MDEEKSKNLKKNLSPSDQDSVSEELATSKIDCIESPKVVFEENSGDLKPPSVVASQISVSSSFMRSSPFPPASELEVMESLCPGTTQFFLDQMQREQKHRHSIDKRKLEIDATEATAGIKRANIGMWIAGIIVLVILLFLFGLRWCGCLGDWSLIAGIIAVLGAFLTSHAIGAKQKLNENDQANKKHA